jgi:chemotaxis protein CheD
MTQATGVSPRPQTVIQGSYLIGDRPDVVLVTILGSCVATCLHDPIAGIGGLNHFLLPEGRGSDQASLKYGLNLMELLINALLKHGARRDRLEAKLFGGAQITRGLTNVGAANGAFARKFLIEEGIRCVSESLGGFQARKVRFWPASGRAQQMLLDGDVSTVNTPVPAPAPKPSEDITFF